MAAVRPDSFISAKLYEKRRNARHPGDWPDIQSVRIGVGTLPGKPEQVLGQLIEAQRAKLLQAHAIMICLREVLLYAERDDAVIYAEAANAAAVLANDVAEALDSVRLKPMLDALRLERGCQLAPERGLSSGVDD
jgi:hypothetical protein